MPNDGVFYTVKLNIKRIQEEEDFIDDSFNAVIDDIDNKVVGISHLTSGAHWHIWEADTAYVVGDVIRWPAMKSHQYAKCIQAGTTSSTRPMVNVNGSEVTNGTTKWKIVSLTSTDDVNGGAIQIWQGGGVLYERGDAVLYASSLYRCKVASHKSSNNFDDDKDNWQEVYASVRPWENNKFYYENDVVIVDLFLYKCLQDHTSLSSFNLPAERSLWSLIGDFSTIKEWETDTVYIENQAVTINGILYRSLYTHTSDSENVYNDMDFWEPIFASIQLWMPDLYYGAGIVVLANNLLYKCTVPHTSESSFDLDKDNWSLIHTIPTSIDDWSTDHEYLVNQIINYQGNIYRVTSDHISGVNFDPTKFELMTDSINDWIGDIYYVVGQYVNYNGSIYKCITANNDTTFIPANWQKMSGGLDPWESNFDYSVGDIVINSNKIYQCNTAHTSSSTFTPDADNWTEISACITRIPNWEANKDYVIGDLVSHDAKIFRCTTPHTSGSTWDATEELNWEELSPTINEISTWTPSTDYEVGQLVIHNNKLYRCNTNHTSDSTSFNTDIAYWNEIGASGIEPWKVNEAYKQGSMVVYNDKIYVCDTAHTSANPFDPTKWHEVSTSDIQLWTTNVEYLVGNNVIYNNKLYRCTTGHTSASTFDITKWEEVSPTKLDDWQASTEYSVGDYVVNSNKIYKCTTAHTSTSTFDKSKWAEISSYDIELWQPSTDYIVGNLVIQDNKIYRCNTAHTSDTTSFGVDIANWDEIGSSGIDSWEQNKLYSTDNIVIYNNKIYKCITGHTSNTTFDPTKWVEVSSSDIDAWSASTDYVVGDFVYKDNQLYRCTTAHTSDSSDFDVDIAKWELLDTKWKAENWVASKLYTANEVVLYDNRIFKCVSTHTSAVDFATDGNYWQALSAKLEPWKASTYYTVGDTVINNNKLYKCIVAHTSDSTSISANLSNWEIVGSGGIDTWRANEAYTASSVVIYNNKIYKCNTAHTSGSTFDSTKWDEISSADIDLWQASTAYKVGNLVIKDNQIYRCKTAHTSSSAFNSDIANWDILDTKWQAKAWVTNAYYLEGEVVLYNNTPYKCITAHTSLGTFELDKADWEPLSANIREWVSGTTYKVGDTVIYSGNIYQCIIAHTATSTFDNTKWEEVSKGGIPYYNQGTSYEVDDQVIYDNKIYKCITAHTSTATFDATKWTEISAGGGGIAEYTTGTSYSSGDLVIKDQALYQANTTTSTTWVESEWDVIGTNFNTTSAYAQKIVTNIVAPYEMLLQVGDSNYCKPPIDVLKKTGGSDNVILTLENYNNTSAYTGTSDFLKIENSKAKLYNYKEYPITPQTLSTIDIGVSDEINFNEFVGSGDGGIDGNTLAVLHFDESWTKDECNNFTWDVTGSPTLSSEVAKFGNSVYLSSAYMISANITPTYPIEIDFWAYLTSELQRWAYLFTWGAYSNSGNCYLGIYTEDSYFVVKLGTGYSMSTNINRNIWTHFCINYDGEKLICFIDGVKYLEQAVSASSLAWSSFTDLFLLGNFGYNPNSRFNGYIDELRISNIIRHTEDFTPPTQPYTRPNYNISSLEVN